MRKNNYNLGGEQSGHIILGDFATTGDGICCALQVMAILKAEKEKNNNCKLSDIVNLYNTVPQKLENIRFDILKGNPLEIEEVKQYLLECEKKLDRIGRILVRKSGTEPLLRVMVECKDEEKLDEILLKICNKIKEYI